MMGLPAGTRIWLAAGVTDMRAGMNGLAAKIQLTLEEDPLAGPLTDVLVHRVEQLLWRCPDTLFHPHESHESGHVDHSFGL